ncbi:hypothetical protein BC940DRAFT_348437 [Gongronella butleri]|nr:hypothetical protein BC940DRAFT_348437 [Gongronella butleri]
MAPTLDSYFKSAKGDKSKTFVLKRVGSALTRKGERPIFTPPWGPPERLILPARRNFEKSSERLILPAHRPDLDMELAIRVPTMKNGNDNVRSSSLIDLSSPPKSQSPRMAPSMRTIVPVHRELVVPRVGGPRAIGVDSPITSVARHCPPMECPVYTLTASSLLHAKKNAMALVPQLPSYHSAAAAECVSPYWPMHRHQKHASKMQHALI